VDRASKVARQLVSMNKQKLVSIGELSKELGPPVRALRTWMWLKKIPYLRVGYRTCLFDVEKVRTALEKFEVKAVTR